MVRILDSSAIDGLVLGMRSILGARGRCMLKLLEGFLDVCGHGDVTNPLVVVPINGETTIEGSSPINGDIIELLERLDEMVRRVFADVLDT